MKTKNEVNNYEPNVVSDVTPKGKKKLNKKHKIIIAICSVVLAIFLVIGIWYLVERNANKWDLKADEITVEYGEVYEPSLEDLIDIEKYSNVTNNNTTIQVNATYEIDINNDNKPMVYYAVGDYDISVSHKIEYKLFGATLFSSDDTKKISLLIRDTVVPVFDENIPTEIEIYKDCEIENIEETFKATDLAPITITIDKENIDFATVGEYTTNVYALDKHDNVANKEIKVKVLEPTITFDKTSLELTVGDTATITATVKGKSQDVEWSSSDESIANVENGNVIANKAGKVTIKAKANNVETTCEVTINEKAVASSNNGSSKKNNKPSNNGGNSSNPSSNGGSNNNSSSNGGGSSSNSNQHSIGVGNIGKWFNSRSELVAYYNSVVNEWNRKVDNGEITNAEYYAKCPAGYECWSCSHCGKWTGNYKYQ